MTPKKNTRLGYTVVDFIAVAGCVALLIVVLTPAILHARDQARDNQCKVKMKAIATALASYHEKFEGLPPGWVTRYRDGDSHAGHGWLTRLLPYLNHGPFYQTINFDQPMNAQNEIFQKSLECYHCPAEKALPLLNPFRAGYGIASYSGCVGEVAPLRWSDGRIEANWPGAAPTFNMWGMTKSRSADGASVPYNPYEGHDAFNYSSTGAFGWNRSIRYINVPDGTSNTIAFGERSQISGWGIWPGVGANRFENDAVTDVSYASVLNGSSTGFSSPHEGGVHFAMLDGSVRFISNGIDSKPEGGLLQFLGNRSDHQDTSALGAPSEP